MALFSIRFHAIRPALAITHARLMHACNRLSSALVDYVITHASAVEGCQWWAAARRDAPATHSAWTADGHARGTRRRCRPASGSLPACLDDGYIATDILPCQTAFSSPHTCALSRLGRSAGTPGFRYQAQDRTFAASGSVHVRTLTPSFFFS